MPTRQTGVALVTVLLVVAIATVMAVTMIREQQASIHLTRGFLSRGQAVQYSLGGEELARQMLFEDFSEAREQDHLAETWASPELHFEFEDGEVNLQIHDLQGFFNMNALSSENRQQGTAKARFLNLLTSNGVDPSVADRLQDWIDVDSSAQPAGAEDYEYLVYKPPYRTGNTLMQDTSELALLGMEPDVYQLLIPHVSAIPDAQASININTATPAVLQSLAPGLSRDLAEALAARRDEQEGFDTVALFLQSPELAGLGVVAAGLGVQSAFFEVRTIARYQERFSYLTSIIYRNPTDGSLGVIYRDFSRNFRPQSVEVGEADG